MLINEDILTKMKKHFPRWMDIRRKYTSTGSLLLESISDEIVDINQAIEDYKKDFFIDNYLDKTNNIIDFLYCAPIGELEDTDKLILLTPNIKIVYNQDIFYNTNEDLCLYHDGYLYFKSNYSDVNYMINNYKHIISLEKIHVWNIYDEFACFVGLKRFQNETNNQLLNRILFKANKTINSTEDGLKNAILTNLINYAPDLSKDDIIIERPTAENLNKFYDDFNSLLDHLSGINRDVYRTKQWDIDTWNFDKKQVFYIPQVWDVVLPEYLNGIGDNDDLKVNNIDVNDTTNVTVNLYNKAINSLNAYTYKNNIKHDFELQLSKYSKDLIPNKVQYQLTASEIEKADIDNVIFHFYSESSDIFNVNLQDIINEDKLTDDIVINDQSILDPNKKYKLTIMPNNIYKAMRINKLNIIDNSGNSTNILQPNSDFKKINNTNALECNKCDKSIDNLNDLTAYNNIKKISKGFTLDNIAKEGFMEINNLNKSNYVYFDYDYSTTKYLYDNLILNNCYVYNDFIKADNIDFSKAENKDKRYIEINNKMNSFSCKIYGAYSIIGSINGERINIIKNSPNNKFVEYKTKVFNTPVDMNIKIILFENGEYNSYISDLYYSKFEIDFMSDNKSLISNQDKSLYYNFTKPLAIKLKTYTGFAPIIKYIYIGQPLKNVTYSVNINTDIGTKIDIDTDNCYFNLGVYDYDNNYQETIYNYKPYKYYSCSKKLKYTLIELNLNDYYDIKEIAVNKADIIIKEYNNTIKYYLKLNNNSVYNTQINGSRKKDLGEYSLTNILNTKGYDDSYSYYATKNINYLIAKKDNNIEYIRIDKEDLPISNSFYIDCDNSNIAPKFIEILDNNINHINANDKYINTFDYISFYAKKSNIYVANNSYDTIYPYMDGIKITNTFTKGYDPTKLMFYTLNTTENNNYIITFSNNTYYSFDESAIKIQVKETSKIDFGEEIIKITFSDIINQSVTIPNKIYYKNTLINLDEYCILPDKNYTVKYDKCSDVLDNKEDFKVIETMKFSTNYCNKLNYCNIDNNELIAIKSDVNITDEDYYIDYNKGILIWRNKELIDNNIDKDFTIEYYIKKAKALIFNEDYIYEQINYSAEAMQLKDSITISNVLNGQHINLFTYCNINRTDLITVKCDKPGFLCSIDKGILSVTNKYDANKLAIKNGYYYYDGQEYYYYINKTNTYINTDISVTLNNVTKDNNNFILTKNNTNYIKNSAMELDNIGTIYRLNTKDRSIDNINLIANLTSCDSYNHWRSVGCNLGITNGLNDQGIYFESIKNFNGYIYINIDKYLINKDKDYIISFYLKDYNNKTGKAYLGYENITGSNKSKFNKETNINILKEILINDNEIDIYSTIFNNETNKKYYLIFQGNGIIDDIIICKKEDYILGAHKKNIDILNLNINENIYNNYSTRLYLTDELGAIFNGTEIKNNNTIINTSYVDWGFTKIKSLNTYEDYSNSKLNNVHCFQFNNEYYLQTFNESGYIETSPIYIGNSNTIKNLLIKINNVKFDNMNYFDTTIYSSDNSKTNFKKIAQSNDNFIATTNQLLNNYIKIRIDIPANKVINSLDIFAEYYENKEKNIKPLNKEVKNGIYISKVLDCQYNERYSISNINIEDFNNLNDYIFQIRASKNNNDNTVWTDWKTINIALDNNKIIIKNRLVFDGYRYFQFKLIINGQYNSIKLNYIDLEVI